MKIFTISDTHFYHRWITIHRGFSKVDKDDKIIPDYDAMHEHMIKEWNSVVGKDDIVLHLGDVTFKGKKKTKEIVERLNGNKILIMGNHDYDNCQKDRHWFRDVGFSNIETDTIRINDLIFSHKPVLNIPEGCTNIHGHIHKHINPGTWELMSLDNNRMNVCIDGHGYKPIDITKVMAHQSEHWSEITDEQ